MVTLAICYVHSAEIFGVTKFFIYTSWQIFRKDPLLKRISGKFLKKRKNSFLRFLKLVYLYNAVHDEIVLSMRNKCDIFFIF